jgi:integrase
MPRRNEGPKLKWHRYGAAWYITWSENGRSRERSTRTADREQAEIIFAEWLQTRGRKQGPCDPSQILVSEVLNLYLQERGPKVAAPERMAYAVLALTDFFEQNTVADVTPQTCGRYAEQRGSNGTSRRELGVLRAAINYAYNCGRITRTVHVELPERPESRDRWLTREEASRLLRASRTPQARLYMPLFILLGLYTGRRKGALLPLRWPQVDLERGLIDFEIPGRQRTNKRRGKIPIPPKAACKRAELEDVTPHTLRHTAATWLMQAGVPLWEVAGFLSMSVETLQRVYGHHHPDYMRGAAEAIGKKSSA